MSYTDEQIKIINEQAKARPGVKYVTNSGKVYKGTVNNRLIAVSGIDRVAIKKDIKVNDRLDALETDVRLKEYTTDVDIKDAKKADKCYVTAASALFG